MNCIFVADIWRSHAELYLLEHRTVILVTPDEDLCDRADGLHQQVSVVVSHCGVFSQDIVHVPD